MTAGLRIINGNSQVQIDDTTIPMMSFVQKGTATFSPAPWAQGYGSGNQGVMEASFTVATSLPIVAWSCGYRCFFNGTVNNGNGTYTFYLDSLAPNGSTVEWFVFGRPQLDATQAGLRVWDANGNLTYFTAANPLKIIGTIASPKGPGTDASAPPGYNTNNYNTTGGCAVIQCYGAVNSFYDFYHNYDRVDSYATCSASGNTVTAGSDIFRVNQNDRDTNFSDPAVGDQYPICLFLVVDITGL